MLSRLQKGRNLPSLHVKRLQHFDKLVDNNIALFPREVYRVIGVRKVDSRSIRNEPV